MSSTSKDTTISKSQVNNNSIVNAVNASPMKGQNSSNGNHFSMMRSIFQRTPKINPENNTVNSINGKNSLYQDNSLYLLKKKSIAIGKTQYNQPLSYNSSPSNDVKQAIRRNRKSGYVVHNKT